MNFSGVRNIKGLPDEVLANILCFLPARSLVKASLVCWRWYNLAKRVLSQRKKFVSRCYCIKAHTHILDEYVLEYLNDIDIIPCAVVVSSHGSDLKLTKRFFSKLASNLPKACILIWARKTGGAIGETWSSHPAKLSADCDFSVLFIPKVAGVTISLFHITKKEFKNNGEQWTSKLNHLVDKDIKFMFLMGKHNSGEHINAIWSNINKTLGGQVIGGGALIAENPFAIVEKKELTPMVLGLAVGGNVEADTIVHSHDTYLDAGGTVAHVIQGMTINQPQLLVSPSVCFLMPCVGIDRRILDKEISEFRKVLPNIKLFGFFGYGEIGTKSSKTNNDSHKKKLPDIMHYYSIGFSILKFL